MTMENTGPGFPIKQFVRIDAADVCDAINNLVVELNALFIEVGIIGNSEVTQKQMRTWLASNGSPLYIYDIDQACPADIANTINIAWDHGDTMTLGDPLYQFIQTTLGFTSMEMLLAFEAMQELTP